MPSRLLRHGEFVFMHPLPGDVVLPFDLHRYSSPVPQWYILIRWRFQLHKLSRWILLPIKFVNWSPCGLPLQLNKHGGPDQLYVLSCWFLLHPDNTGCMRSGNLLLGKCNGLYIVPWRLALPCCRQRAPDLRSWNVLGWRCGNNVHTMQHNNNGNVPKHHEPNGV